MSWSYDWKQIVTRELKPVIVTRAGIVFLRCGRCRRAQPNGSELPPACRNGRCKRARSPFR